MSKTIESLINYIPYDEQEKKDKEFIIQCEQKLGDILHRTNEICHLCSSAFIVNPERTKVLCIFHNIYKSWGWVGGHADGDDDMLYVAKKETQEETSLQNFRVVSLAPISIDTLPVISHFKKGKFVPAHIHLCFTYLIEADETETVHMLEEENSNVGWLTFDELVEKSTEPHMQNVYKKIKNKIKNKSF
ncbi:MAG: NUDIX hydrolase [Clostridia bacterium]